MVKFETRRDAETRVRKPSPRLFGKKFRDSKKVKTNHAKTRLRDLSKTLPRFRDPVKIFRDPRFSRYHSPPLISYVAFLSLQRLFCPGFVYVTYYHILQSETKGPHHIHSLRSSCFTKKSALNVAGNLVMVVKFTFQSVFGNSLQNPRHFSARGREESLELYSIL